MECNREFLAAQIGSFHFENCIKLHDTDPAKVIMKHYFSIIHGIELDKLKTLSKDFYNRNSDIGIFHLFQNALRYASSQGEAYYDIKSIFFEIVKCIEEIVFHFSKIVISIQAVIINFISFYKCLMQDKSGDYENAAYAILASLDGYQMDWKSIFVSAEQIPLQLQGIIENFVTKYFPRQEQFEPCHISKLKKPILLLQISLKYLDNTRETVISSYRIIKDAMIGRLNAHTVKQDHFKSWNSHVAKESFLDYYSYLVALCLSCINIKNVLEDLLINLQSMIHEI